MRTAKDIIKSKPLAYNFIQPGALVIDALTLLNSVNLSYLIVKEGEEYKGLFSERDYTRNVILKGRASKTATVQEVMTTDLPIVEITDTVEHCMNMMNLYRVRYLLVYDDQYFAGVITIHDLLRQVITGKEKVADNSPAGKLMEHDAGSRIY